ncbi:AAA family ATPase [Flexivirga sp. B27]
MTFIVQLVGPPASGKRTIGALLAERTGAALIDNHLVNDPVFTAIGADGFGQLPKSAFVLAKRVAEVVHEAVLAAPAELGHIFTKFWVDEPGDAAQEVQMRALAQRRGVPFYPVWLTCDADELCRRVVLPERRTRNKMRDPDALADLIRMPVLPTPDDALQLDTTQLDADEAAAEILAWIDAHH